MPTQRFPRQTGLSSIKSVRYRRFPVVDVSTGGGGGTFNQYTMFRQQIGPASYDSTNGWVIDLSATYSSLNSLRLALKKGTRGNLGIGRWEVVLNSPIAGKATISFFKHRYDRITAFGNVQNQPGGVTVAAASGQVTSSETAHTHGINHDHASFNAGSPNNAGAAVTLDVLGPNMSTHTHSLDLPALVGTSGAGTSHNHTDDSIYQHWHHPNITLTNPVLTEITNATNLSASTFYVLASGVRT